MRKKWIELLGHDTNLVHVDANRIVRGFDTMTILWSFDNQEKAEKAFKAWLEEIAEWEDL